MPSRRMIDPAFWQSYSMAQLTRNQRLLFIGIFSNADDQGRLRGHPGLIRSMVFPLDDIAIEEIESDLAAIAETGSIYIYEVEDHKFIQIVKWWEYQAPQWAYPSQIQTPNGWHDRLRYRKGDAVQKHNWEGEGGFANGIPNAIGEPIGKATGIVTEQSSDSVDPSIDTNGASAPPANLDGWLEILETESNRPATLKRMVETLYPKHDDLDYGYIGKTAKTVGGAGRLAALLWQANAFSPKGDVLRYCMGMAKSKTRAPPPSRHDLSKAAAQELLQEIDDGDT